jgi:hypothetical protein
MMKLPPDFDLLEARERPLYGFKDATPSRRWIMEQARTIAATLEGLPCGVADMILLEADSLVTQASDRAAESAEFCLDFETAPKKKPELSEDQIASIKATHAAMKEAWIACSPESNRHPGVSK